MSTFEYVDPDDGFVYELNYIVTQHDDEGPEYVAFRVKPSVAGSLGKAAEYVQDSSGWTKLPPWATPPQEAIDFWHGEVKKADHRQGVIVAMRDDDTEALCSDFDGMYFADLQFFTNVSEPDGDFVAPGMVVEVGLEATRPVTDPEIIRTWMLLGSS